MSDSLKEQLAKCEADREKLAAGIADWLGSQGYSAAERVELFSSFLSTSSEGVEAAVDGSSNAPLPTGPDPLRIPPDSR